MRIIVLRWQVLKPLMLLRTLQLLLAATRQEEGVKAHNVVAAATAAD
jgi:hypothetical protein